MSTPSRGRSSGGGGGSSAAAKTKTKKLGYYDQEAPEDEVEEAQREKAGWDGGITSWVIPGSWPSSRKRNTQRE